MATQIANACFSSTVQGARRDVFTGDRDTQTSAEMSFGQTSIQTAVAPFHLNYVLFTPERATCNISCFLFNTEQPYLKLFLPFG